MGILRGLVIVAVLGSAALADDTRAEDRVNGFIAPSTGELEGRVTDADGKPLANARVHIATRSSERIITTDKNGDYRVTITEHPSMVFVHGDARIEGSAAASAKVDDHETIVLREALQPAKLARPLSSSALVPDYTDEAIDRNAWTRAWLLLDVSETGVVTRLKVLNPPGYGLEPIAIREGFDLFFEPARDRADRPIRTQVVWVFEWPSFWWLKQQPSRRLTRAVLHVPCRGSGPTRTAYRDCSPANVAAAITARWIDRPRK